MAKKSFFERLVGATEEIRKNQSEETPVPKKISTDSSRAETKNKPAQNESKSETIAPELTTEEWPSTEEGQLTIDVYQTDTDIVIKSTIAGVKSDDIDISVAENMITIKGKRARDEKVNPENYYYQELYWGPFSRSVILPIDVDTDKIRASLKDGILTIRLPKTEGLKIKTIKVKEIE